MKLFIISLITFVLLATTTRVALADDVCVQSYGQPVVCGTHTPEYHVPVKTGLSDVNFTIIGFTFLVGAGVLYKVSSRKTS